MNSQICVEDRNLRCPFDYGYIIAVMRRLYGKDDFIKDIRFFDKDENIDSNTHLGLEQFERSRKGMNILDYFGFDRDTFALEHLESIVQNDSLVVSADNWGIEGEIPAGLSVAVQLDNLPGRSTAQSTYSSHRLEQRNLVYKPVEFEKATTRKQDGDSTLISYSDGTQMLLRIGNDSMGEWFYLELLKNRSRIAGGYGSAGPFYYHDGLLFLPLGGGLPLVICINDCSSGKKAIIPEIKKVTFDKLSIDITWDVNYGNDIHSVYQRVG